jgi:8-oxo-dGTP pyrophosphatase MutT (NUDIX family)
MDGLLRAETVPSILWWELPGGGLAEGEDSAAACRRELAEETGITDVEIGPIVRERESLFRYRIAIITASIA